MANILKIENLNYKNILNNINIELVSGQFVSLVGPNGSGKTMLFKVLSGNYKYSGNVYFNNKKYDNKYTFYISNEITFVSDIVYDNVIFSLKCLNISDDDILEIVTNIFNLFNINDLMYENVYKLNYYEKVLINLISVLVCNPKVLLLDNAFSKLDNNEQNKIFKILKKLAVLKNILIINSSHRSDDILFSDKVIIMDKGKVIMSGLTVSMLDNEKLFTKLGIELPFLVDLSIKLRYYNLLDKIVFSAKDMVNMLWK